MPFNQSRDAYGRVSRPVYCTSPLSFFGQILHPDGATAIMSVMMENMQEPKS